MTHKITRLPLSELVGNPGNPKAHDEALLDRSLTRFGYVEPIVRDDRTGMLISGHGRRETLERLKAAGEPPPEGVTARKDGEWVVPVVTGWASKDDDEANAVLVQLNRATERGGWDPTALLTILDSMSGDDLTDAGYEPTDLALLARQVEAAGAMTADLSQVIDEFRDQSGIGKTPVALIHSTVLRVYFQTPEARAELMDLIGYDDDGKQAAIRYPSTFHPEARDTWTG